ncbi:MAG: decaprenyl-phosphate phosphoribosyltransferase [Planctomycetes bacterium]|nr:decaprenyl-phosphate phosphoribosyltransferase [Planctomycetota bacterium]
MSSLALLRAMRPQQWSKNVFVLAALAFAWGDRTLGPPVGAAEAWRVLSAFAAFCCAASAIYLVNDVLDAEQDRQHPEKRSRPIASGELSIPVALGTAVVLAIAALLLARRADAGAGEVALVVGGYTLMNLAYSLKLKHVALLDVFCIALGFLLRVVAGGLASGAPVSHWLLLCTLFLALFLALNKRRAELALLGDGGANHRASLGAYTLGFLDQMVTVVAAATLVCYALYTVDPQTSAKFGGHARMLWTVPCVVFGLARYMLLVQGGRAGGNPTRMFLGADPLFLANTLLWAALVAWAIKG